MKYEEMLEVLITHAEKIKSQIGNDSIEEQVPALFHSRVEAIMMAVRCLKDYVEPWMCPMCGHTSKIPDDHKNKRHCPKCHNEHMLPYAYLEQERMNSQMKHLLVCANHYMRQPNGQLATNTLKELAQIGQYKPQNTGGQSQE